MSADTTRAAAPVRYRYQIHTAAGEVLSRHSSYLGALDAIAAIRARAARQNVEPDAAVYRDGRLLKVNATDLGADEEAEGLHLRLTRGQKARLREVARSVGLRAERGPNAGEPSINRLVDGIGDGELVVSRRP